MPVALSRRWSGEGAEFLVLVRGGTECPSAAALPGVCLAGGVKVFSAIPL